MTRRTATIRRTRATATPPPTPAAMAAEDLPEEEEEGWSVEAVEISEELGTVSAVRAKELCKVMEASGELG